MSHSLSGGGDSSLVPHASRVVQRSRTGRLQSKVNIAPFLSDRQTPGLPISPNTVQSSPLSLYPQQRVSTNEGRSLLELSQHSTPVDHFSALKGFIDVNSTKTQDIKRPVTTCNTIRRSATVTSKHISSKPMIQTHMHQSMFYPSIETTTESKQLEFQTLDENVNTSNAKQIYEEHLHLVKGFLDATKPDIHVQKKAYTSKMDKHAHITLVEKIDILLSHLATQDAKFKDKYQVDRPEKWTSSMLLPDIRETLVEEPEPDSAHRTMLPYTVLNTTTLSQKQPIPGIMNVHGSRNPQEVSGNHTNIPNCTPLYEKIPFHEISKQASLNPFQQRSIQTMGMLKNSKIQRDNDNLKFEVHALRQYLGNAKGLDTEVLEKDSSIILGKHVADQREVCSHLMVRQEHAEILREEMSDDLELVYIVYNELYSKQTSQMTHQEVMSQNQVLLEEKQQKKEETSSKQTQEVHMLEKQKEGLVLQKNRLETQFHTEEIAQQEKQSTVTDKLQIYEFASVRQAAVASRLMAYVEEQGKDAIRSKDVERQQMYASAEVDEQKQQLRENVRQGSEAQDALAVLVRVAEEAGGKQNISERDRETGILEKNRLQRRVLQLESEVGIVQQKLKAKEKQGHIQVLGSDQNIETLQKKISILENTVHTLESERQRERQAHTKRVFEQTRVVKDMEQNCTDWTQQQSVLKARLEEEEAKRAASEKAQVLEQRRVQTEETKCIEHSLHALELEQQQKAIQVVHDETIEEIGTLRDAGRDINAAVHNARIEEMRLRNVVMQQAQDQKALQSRLEANSESHKMLSKTLLEQQTQGVLDNQEQSTLRPMRVAIENTVRRAQDFERAYQDEKTNVEQLKQSLEISEHEKTRLKEEVTLLRLKYSAQVAIRDEQQAKIQNTTQENRTIDTLFLDSLQSTLDELMIPDQEDLTLPPASPSTVPIDSDKNKDNSNHNINTPYIH